MVEPHVEEGRVICLHQLKAPITVLLQPTVHVDQTVRQHSAFLMKPLVDSVLPTRQEGLDNHVSLHRRLAPPGHCFTARQLSTPGPPPQPPPSAHFTPHPVHSTHP